LKSQQGESRMKVKVINPSSDSRWDEYVEKHSLGCVFHHSAWKEVLNNTFPQLEPFYFVVENSDGAIKGGIPLFLVKSWITGTRLVSLPFSLYCDPLVDSQEEFQLLLDGILSKQRESGAGFIAIRTRLASDLFRDTKLEQYIGYKNHTLSLDHTLKELKKSFHRTCVRQRISRGEKSNLGLVEASAENHVKVFYELHCMTRKKFGVPPQPYKFFKNMWDTLYPQKMLGILIATFNDKPVCSILFLKYKDRVHAEYMGTDDAFLKYSPNVFLFWRSIQKAKDEAYNYFDFGGSSIHSSELITFKRRWGTLEEDLSHFYFPAIRGLSTEFENTSRFSILSRVSRKMPARIFKWTGHLLYRHLGG